jgi:hypothetical protein
MSNNTETSGISTAWRPSAGDSITITITDLTEHDAGYGAYPIIEGETASGEMVTLHAFHDVLKSELAKFAPSIGDTLTVTYGGKHPDRGYHRWKVGRGAGAGPGLDWSKYGSESSTVPASNAPADPPPALPVATVDEDIPF